VACGAGFLGKPLRARDLAVDTSAGADLSAEKSAFPFAENLRATMQKSRRVNNFKRFAATRVCISLGDWGLRKIVQRALHCKPQLHE
jgi:hypothetical protein